MSEQDPPEDPDVIARNDQAIAASRHVAQCVVRYYDTLVAGGLPAKLIADLITEWQRWFILDGDPDQDDE